MTKIATSYLRGHKIELNNQVWIYCDNGEPTVGNERQCGHCSKPNTKEGHDGCLGTLPNVMNACCGHGQDNQAYVQFEDKHCIRGKDALKAMDTIIKRATQ